MVIVTKVAKERSFEDLEMDKCVSNMNTKPSHTRAMSLKI